MGHTIFSHPVQWLRSWLMVSIFVVVVVVVVLCDGFPLFGMGWDKLWVWCLATKVWSEKNPKNFPQHSISAIAKHEKSFKFVPQPQHYKDANDKVKNLCRILFVLETFICML